MDESGLPLQRVNAEAASRARRAWEMRVAGHGWDSIADELGYSFSTNAARAATRYAESLPQPDRAQMRDELRGRVRWLWTEAKADVEDRRPGAVRAAAAVLQRWSQLEGADAPTKVEVSPSAERMEEAIQLLIAHQQSGSDWPEADVFEDVDVIEEGDRVAHNDPPALTE